MLAALLSSWSRSWRLRVVVASLLAASGILFPATWACAPLGLSLLLHTLWFRTRRASSAALAGLFFGTLTGAAAVWWFWDSIPLDWLGIPDAGTAYAGVGITWLYIGVWLGGAVAAAGVLLYLVRRSAGWMPLLAAGIWMVAEEARMWGFAIGTWAPQSLLGGHFSAASVGYALAENGLLLQLADPFGIAALNFFAALLAGGAAFMVGTRAEKGATRFAPLVAGMLLTMSAPLLTADASPASGQTLRFALISTSVPAGARSYDQVRALLAEALDADAGADVVVLPEDVPLVGGVFATEEEKQAFWRERAGGRALLVAHSAYELNAMGSAFHGSERLWYETTDGAFRASYRKMFLMPLGEYAPAFSDIFYGFLADEGLHRHLAFQKTDNERGGRLVAVDWKGARLGGLLCSELISPPLYRSLVEQEGADILLNLANQAWFHGSHTLYDKILQIGRVHAVANRRFLLSAMNAAPSFVITPEGVVAQASPWGTSEILFADIPVPAPRGEEP